MSVGWGGEATSYEAIFRHVQVRSLINNRRSALPAADDTQAALDRLATVATRVGQRSGQHWQNTVRHRVHSISDNEMEYERHGLSPQPLPGFEFQPLY